MQAGLYGNTYWQWLFVEYLWIADAHRGSGLGARLLDQAEVAARDRGCIGACVNTMSFQAPAFYERHGYREFGRLHDVPPGHARIWLAKRFTSNP